MKHTIYIIDKLFDTSPIFFNEFKDAYPQSLNLLFRNDEQSDFEIYVEKISISLLSKRNLSKENDVVLCLADTTPHDKSLIYIPFIDESKDVENNQFPHLNAFYIPQVTVKDFSTQIHDLTFTILSRLGIDHFHRKVFISYRRGERENIALNLFRDLASDMFIEKWKSYGRFKKSLWRLWSKISSLIAKMIWKEKLIIDFDWMSKEHAYQMDFLTNRVFSCPNCIKTGHNIDSFKDENFIRQFIHIGDKDEPVLGYFTLDRKQFLDAIEKGYVECPTCHKRVKIKRNPSQDFYLWKKWTVITNSENNDWYIEKVPAYSVIDA